MRVVTLVLVASLSCGLTAMDRDVRRYIGDGEVADLALEVAEDKNATLYLAHKPTNVPFADAKVQLQQEGGESPVLFEPTQLPGVYTATLTGLDLAGREIILETSDDSDSITISDAETETSRLRSGDVSQPASGSGRWSTTLILLLGMVLGALVATLALTVTRFGKRVKEKTVPTLLILLVLPMAFLDPHDALGHAGHDHGGSAPSDEKVEGGDGVSLSKKSQFLIGLTTILARREPMAEAMVAYGHIIPKPQLDATIIAPQSGVIRTSPDMILGMTVGKGHALGTLDAVNQIRINSPIAGQIQKVGAVSGTRVESGTELFRVTDPSTVWVDAELFASDLRKLRDVTDAFVGVDGDESIRARILNITSPISEETRTAKVYLELDNATGGLRIGALARITFVLKDTSDSIAAPASAVLNRNGEYIVFVQSGPEKFLSRTVRPEVSSRAGTVLISEGVREGERIVVTGNYQLLLKVR